MTLVSFDSEVLDIYKRKETVSKQSKCMLLPTTKHTQLEKICVLNITVLCVKTLQKDLLAINRSEILQDVVLEFNSI